jgi:hypothetical protein
LQHGVLIFTAMISLVDAKAVGASDLRTELYPLKNKGDSLPEETGSLVFTHVKILHSQQNNDAFKLSDRTKKICTILSFS